MFLINCIVIDIIVIMVIECLDVIWQYGPLRHPYWRSLVRTRSINLYLSNKSWQCIYYTLYALLFILDAYTWCRTADIAISRVTRRYIPCPWLINLSSPRGILREARNEIKIPRESGGEAKRQANAGRARSRKRYWKFKPSREVHCPC